MNLSQAKQDRIIEEYQVNQYRSMTIREAIAIATDLLDGMAVCTFNRKSHHTDDGGYNEGWVIDPSLPTIHTNVGSLEVLPATPSGLYFITMEYEKNTAKKSYPLPTRNWTHWYLFNLMFSNCGLTLHSGVIGVTNDGRKLLRERINEINTLLTPLTGNSMYAVMKRYTIEELTYITTCKHQRIQEMIDELDELIRLTGRSILPSPPPLFAKGLRGPAVAARFILNLRKEFWVEYLKVRENPIAMSKGFNRLVEIGDVLPVK